MRKIALIVCALLAGPVFAGSGTTTTGASQNGLQISGNLSQVVGGKTVTLSLGNNAQPKLSAVNAGADAGSNAGTMSVGLSLSAVLGGGFANTGGTAGSLAGFGF